MRRSSDYTSKPQQPYGWDTNSSYDYHSHIHRMERVPTMLPEIPQYPNVHKAFNNKVSYEEEYRGESDYKHGHNKHQTAPVRFQEKVEVIEYERADEQFEAGGKNVGSCEVYEESVDVEADSFIKQKHKGLELCKWKTFKAH
ncbi:hypothetical protein SLA2020_270350 [Shorea laevis]